ncbi:MAG TPA: hypothetical protein VK466_01165 [Terriglobales bacterium]|nr:hypothetical protein [Terriglobales bacterium]
MDDLMRFCCQNPQCTLYARRNAGNLSVCARYGKQDHIRLLYCKACKDRFSERKEARQNKRHFSLNPTAFPRFLMLLDVLKPS